MAAWCLENSELEKQCFPSNAANSPLREVGLGSQRHVDCACRVCRWSWFSHMRSLVPNHASYCTECTKSEYQVHRRVLHGDHLSPGTQRSTRPLRQPSILWRHGHNRNHLICQPDSIPVTVYPQCRSTPPERPLQAPPCQTSAKPPTAPHHTAQPRRPIASAPLRRLALPRP